MTYSFDVTGFIGKMMPTIFNSRLPNDIKESWIEFALITNIQLLHESVIVYN